MTKLITLSKSRFFAFGLGCRAAPPCLFASLALTSCSQPEAVKPKPNYADALVSPLPSDDRGFPRFDVHNRLGVGINNLKVACLMSDKKVWRGKAHDLPNTSSGDQNWEAEYLDEPEGYGVNDRLPIAVNCGFTSISVVGRKPIVREQGNFMPVVTNQDLGI